MSTYYAVHRESKVHRKMDGPLDYLFREEVRKADNEGWIKWAGGECPLPGEQMVEVRYRHGGTSTNRADTWNLCWKCDDSQDDIIAYRPVLEQEKTEPDIDWSKAPEGATHYYKSMWSWYKEVNDVLYVFSPKYGWEESIYTIGDLPLIPRPTESDNSWHERGEFPPVGAVCEVSLTEPEGDSRSEFKEVTLKGYYGGEVWFTEKLTGRSITMWADNVTFRPIKTDRERTIEAAQEILSTGFLKADLEALYDSGLLRMPEDE